MQELPQHEMQLETTHPSGAEEWYCPTCGRRFLMHWPPAYEKVLLAPGDENASHSGGKGGLSVSLSQVTQVEEPGLTGKLQQGPWAEWLESIDSDDWWDETV